MFLLLPSKILKHVEDFRQAHPFDREVHLEFKLKHASAMQAIELVRIATRNREESERLVLSIAEQIEQRLPVVRVEHPDEMGELCRDEGENGAA